jgi:hypothetical protein
VKCNNNEVKEKTEGYPHPQAHYTRCQKDEEIIKSESLRRATKYDQADNKRKLIQRSRVSQKYVLQYVQRREENGHAHAKKRM